MKARLSLLSLFLVLFSVPAMAQLGVGTTTPDPSAELHVSSTTRGLLPPVMTQAQRNAINGGSPATGLFVYCSDCSPNGYYMYNGTAWVSLTNTDAQSISRSGLTVSLSNGGSFQDSVLTETEVDQMVANNGYLTSFTEVDGSTTNEIQSISRSGTTVSLSNGGGTFQDSVLTESQVDQMVANNGYLSSFTEVDGSTTNEIQTISRTGTTVSLSNSGGTFQDSVLTESQVDAMVGNNGYLTSFTEVDGSTTNEIQTISRTGTTVTLSNSGGSFQDSVLTESQVDNMVANNGFLTDEVDGSNTNELQTISRTGTTVTLSNSGGSFQDSVLTESQVDAMVGNNGYLTSFTEVDGSTTNEIQTISRSGTTVSLSNSGGTFQDSVLTESQVDAMVGNNGYLTSFTEVDGSTTNEIQTISRTGTTVTLSNSGGTFQDSVLTESQVDAMVGNNGYLTSFTELDGSTSNEIQTISRTGLTVTLEGGGSYTDSVLTETEVDQMVANNGYLTSFTEADGSTSNELQTISKTGSTVTLSNSGGSFTDDVLTESQVDAYANNNGYLTSEVDGSTSNELQTISKSGSTVTLSNSGGSFTDDVLTESQVDAYANNNGYLTSEVDGSTSNELQTISKTGSTITLSNSGGSFTDDVLTESQVDSYVANNGYLTSFTEVDGSTSNELQTISKTGSTVTLSNSGGSFTDDVLTEAQVDAYAGNNGYLTDEVDGSNTNELQTISKSGSTVTLSNSGGSFTDDVLTETQVDAYVANNGYLTSASLPISTDGNLADNSDAEVPSEKAVKSYVDGQIGNINTMYGSDGDVSSNRQVTIGNGRWFRFRSFDLSSSNFLSESRLTLQNGTAYLSAFTGDGTGAYTESNGLTINQTRSLINGDFRTQTGSADGITTFDLLHSGVMTISRNHANAPSISTAMASGNPEMTFNNNGTDRIVLSGTGTSFFTNSLEARGGLTMASGTNINEFSTDNTLGGNSNDAVPTEAAVKTYVDNAVSGVSGASALQLSSSGTDSYYIHSSNFNTVSASVRNTALGYNVMNSVHGSHCIGIGHNTMEDISGGGMFESIAIGNNSMQNVVSATYSVGIGGSTLDAVNSATSNIAIGFNSMTNVSSGGYNVGVGVYTLDALTTGERNTAIGHQSGGALTTGQYNTYIGSDAGLYNNGSNNVFIGRQAGNSATTADGGVFIGYGAGYNETGDNMLYIENSSATAPLIGGSFSGDRVGINVATSTISAGGATLQVGGDLSLLSGTSVNELSIDGTLGGNSDDALPTEKAVRTYVTTEINNAAQLKTTGTHNYHSNLSNFSSILSTAYYNQAEGYQAINKVTSGDYNMGYGSWALFNNTTGSYNTAIGLQALYRNISGSYNTAVGKDAGMDITGSYNTVMGHEAAENTTGSSNVIIGRRAGYNAQTDNSIFIGYQAGYSEDNSDRLYIENSSTTQPLIGGSFSHNVVTINTDIGGTGFDFAAHASNKAYNLFINGGAYKSTGGTGWNHSSDRRLKTDITYMNSRDMLDKVLQMKGVSYTWNDTVTGLMRDEGIQYGFIAQDLQKVWPEKIIDDPYGYLATSYGTYDAMFVESIRALNDKISRLEIENEALKAQAETQKDQQTEIDELRAELDELKDLIKAQAQNNQLRASNH